MSIHLHLFNTPTSPRSNGRIPPLSDIKLLSEPESTTLPTHVLVLLLQGVQSNLISRRSHISFAVNH